MSRPAPALWPYHRHVADVPPSELRIGDTERESALTALGEHMSAGRLDIEEYGDRTAKVSAAKTRGELSALFTDLPAPHPAFGAKTTPTAVPVPQQPPAGPPMPINAGMPMSQRLMAAAMPMAVILAVLLFFTAGHMWEFFLIPAAVGILGGVIWGDDWKHNQRMVRDRQREERRAIRRRYRGW